MVLQCAWCDRVKLRQRWLPIRPTGIRPVSHGICPKCSEKMLADARQIIGRVRDSSWSETRMIGSDTYLELNPLPHLQ